MRYIFLLSVALNLYLAYFIAKRFYYSRVPPILWKYDVALIGDSHVYRGDWNKLLPCSSANFGKGKDSLQGMYNRMAGVLNCQPKVCVIHGGINDVINNIPPDTTMKYYRLIIERLREAGIKPIIIPVMRPAYHKYDDKIEALNNRINSLASELGVSVRYVDITNDDLQQDVIPDEQGDDEHQPAGERSEYAGQIGDKAAHHVFTNHLGFV